MDRRIEAGYWRDIIGAEYDGLPALSLTVVQAMRLWSIDEDIARRVLDSYVESGYLTLTSEGRYRRTDINESGVDSYRREDLAESAGSSALLHVRPRS